MDLVNGGRGEGLTHDEMQEIVTTFRVPTTLIQGFEPAGLAYVVMR